MLSRFMVSFPSTNHHAEQSPLAQFWREPVHRSCVSRQSSTLVGFKKPIPTKVLRNSAPDQSQNTCLPADQSVFLHFRQAPSSTKPERRHINRNKTCKMQQLFCYFFTFYLFFLISLLFPRPPSLFSLFGSVILKITPVIPCVDGNV